MRLNPQHPDGLLKRGFIDAYEDYPGMRLEAIGWSAAGCRRGLNASG